MSYSTDTSLPGKVKVYTCIKTLMRLAKAVGNAKQNNGDVTKAEKELADYEELIRISDSMIV